MNAIAPYGSTAARSHGRPGRETRPRSVTIDIHSHVAVPEAAAIVAPHLDISTIPLAFFSTPETKEINGKQEADRGSRMSGRDDGLALRLRDLDDMGIDRQLVMPPPPQCYYTVPLEISVNATRVVNDGIAAYVARRPDRFRAWARCRCPTEKKPPPNSNAGCATLASRASRCSPMSPDGSFPILDSLRSGRKPRNSER